MSTVSLDETMRRLHRFILDQLPLLNNLLIERDMPQTLLEAARPICADVVGAVAGGVSDGAAHTILQETAFIASSAERHLQAARGAAGEAVQALGLAPVLNALGSQLGHVPRDSHYTYWLHNRGPEILTFTGEAQERLFASTVIQTQDLHAASTMALRPLCDGDVEITSAGAKEALRFATANFQRLIAGYRHFMSPASDRPGQWQLTPEFFTTVMRTYLLAYPVDGQLYTGPNATNIPGQLSVDFLIGAIDDEYREVARRRMAFLNAFDRALVSRDAGRRSIFGAFLARLALSYEAAVAMPDEALAEIVVERGAASTALAVAGLARASSRLSSVHFSLVHNYLRKPIAGVTAEELHRLPVPPTHGVGNATHEETQRLMEMRRDPLMAKLTAVERIVAPRSSAAA